METLPLFQQPCGFIAGAASVASLPPITHPEIAFIGRSNAGKSSLVNALIGSKTLAKTSANPGHTKQLNFFLLGNRLMLVDMPGYGYAGKVSKEKKGEWDNLIRSYLFGRPNLQRICLLIDGRRGAMKHDEEFMSKLDDAAVTYQIVVTKTDMLSARDLSSVLQSLQKTVESHPAAHPEIIPTSAVSKLGIENLQEQLLPFAESTI